MFAGKATSRTKARMRREADGTPLCEQLEERVLLSLLGIGEQIGNPELQYDRNGTVVYDSTLDEFNVDAMPTAIALEPLLPGQRPSRILDPSDFLLQIKVDGDGNLIGGVEGDDLAVSGQFDADGDRVIDYSGLLLTGEIVAFGYLDNPVSDQYEFRLTPTGGALLPFFEGYDIGIDMLSLDSTFADSFAVDFTGGSQGTLGVIPQLPPPPSTVAGRVYIDSANDGSAVGDAGIAGVTIQLSGTDDDGNSVDLSAVTAADGSYIFEDIAPGTYAVSEVQPAGYLDGIDTVGSAGGVLANDAISEIVLAGGEEAEGYNFGELEAASLSGMVYLDLDNDGVLDAEEEVIADVEVTLTGTDDLGNAVTITTQTGADGVFEFTGLRPGSYTLTEAQPEDLLDGQSGAGSLGGTAGYGEITEITVASGDEGVDYLFGEIEPASLSGMVYVDFNDDGEADFNENIIEGVTVTLTGVDDRGNAVNFVTQTDAEGDYVFAELRPGTYTITESQPAGFVDGQDVLGSLGGTMGNDQMSDVAVNAGEMGINYDFGERPEAGDTVACGQTAKVGFWRSWKGRRLIKSLNGGCQSTQLANWLAATFPKMYGVEAGENNLTGMTNYEVTKFYKKIFRAKKCGRWWGRRYQAARQLDAQVMALAFATYVTNQSLAGTAGEAYGFTVTEYGVGIATYNIGSAGEAFGVADDTEMTVMDILQATNDQAVDGVLYEGDRILRSMANAVYTAINESGSIGLCGCEFVNWLRARIAQLMEQFLCCCGCN